MILLELLLAGILRCVGLPPADLELMTDTLVAFWRCGIGAVCQQKVRGNEGALGSR